MEIKIIFEVNKVQDRDISYMENSTKLAIKIALFEFVCYTLALKWEKT